MYFVFNKIFLVVQFIYLYNLSLAGGSVNVSMVRWLAYALVRGRMCGYNLLRSSNAFSFLCPSKI